MGMNLMDYGIPFESMEKEAPRISVMQRDYKHNVNSAKGTIILISWITFPDYNIGAYLVMWSLMLHISYKPVFLCKWCSRRTRCKL